MNIESLKFVYVEISYLCTGSYNSEKLSIIDLIIEKAVNGITMLISRIISLSHNY